MLKIATYTKQELVEIFNTNRMDSIKRSLQRLGFEFTTKGRDSNYTITITSAPSAFKLFAIEELKFDKRTYFDGLELYLQLFFLDEDFRTLPVSQQVNVMKAAHNEEITRQTIANWRKKIIEIGLVHEDSEDCRYYSVKSGDAPFELTKEEYKRYWGNFYKVLSSTGSAAEAWNNMFYEAGGKCCKVNNYQENGFYNETIDTLIQILQK